MSQSDSSRSSVPAGDVDTADFPNDNSRNDAQSSDDFFAAQDERVTTLKKILFLKIDAMNDETNALLRNDTWEIVDLPKDRKAIGFNQKEGIDYEKTFSPVVKMVTVRCLLNLVVSSYWHVFQLDVNNTFIYGDLNETMYMKLLE
nr:ribonuclease H-like domain-containing protein [Tanacetum cinerariifolium]